MTRKEILEKTIDFDDAIHRIVRLEKENAELKKACDETQELLDKQIEATYKLDKENAELKEGLRDANEKVVHLACNQNKDLKYKLTKTKELLEDFICYAELADCNLYIKEQAEQFLKKVENDRR